MSPALRMHIQQLRNHGNVQNATQLILFCCLIKLSKQTLQLFLSQMPRLDIGLWDVIRQTSENAAFADSLHPRSSLWMNSQSNAGSAVLFCVVLVHTGPDLLSNIQLPARRLTSLGVDIPHSVCEANLKIGKGKKWQRRGCVGSMRCADVTTEPLASNGICLRSQETSR